MEHFTFPFSTPDEGQESLAPLAGRMIGSPSSELEIRFPAQIGFRMPGPITTSTHPTNAFQQATWLQLLEQSRVSFSSDNSQTSFPHRQPSNSKTIMDAIAARYDIATFRDTVCSYLRLTSGLWTELYKPREYSTAHHLLTRYLCQEYGRLPPDLWRLINELRDQYDFETLRYECIDIISSIPTPPDLFLRGLAPSGCEGRDSGGTRSTTPVSVANSRKKIQSPSHQRAKGRAPKGERYKCPYMNCRHEAFRNAGNFTNHMSKCHAESEYHNRHPANFLVPDSSPQPSNQGDTMSSAVTNASDSPLTRRRLSQESGVSEDGGETAGDDGLGHIRDIAFMAEQDGFQDEFQTGTGQGVIHEGSPGASVTSGLESSSLLEAFRFVPITYRAQPIMSQDEGIQGCHYPSQDEVGYGQL